MKRFMTVLLGLFLVFSYASAQTKGALIGVAMPTQSL